MATVRPISPQYQHTLDSAISLAKELASKNMADSGESSPKTPNSPDKRRFNFKFKPFSKSFSEASANIRDIESSISFEEKQAYSSLIERGPFNNHHTLSSSISSSTSSYSNHHHHHHHHHHYNHQHNSHLNQHPQAQPFGFNSHTFGRSGSRSSSGSSSSRGSSALHSPLHDPLLSRPFASHAMHGPMAHHQQHSQPAAAAAQPHYANDDFSTSPTSISSASPLSSKTFKRGCSTFSVKKSFF